MKIIISVISDLVTDQRVHKTAQVLHEQGYDVLLVGRKLKSSKEMPYRDYKVKRVKLWFEKGVFFYANFNIWNFFFLLFNKVNVLHSNDLDTLLPNFLVSKIKNIPLVYDSHEYFTGVPEIQHKKVVKAVWQTIESFVFPKLKNVYTVNETIAKIYSEKYKVAVGVVRNVPILKQEEINVNILPSENVIVYQGALNIDRGLEEIILAMNYLDDVKLIIIGGGDVENDLIKLVSTNHLENKVIFKGKIKYDEMMSITKTATIGISIEKSTNDNYKYCLPNKLFDYLHVGVPVLVSNIEEIANVINKYKVGCFIENHEPKHIAAKLKQVLADKNQLLIWKQNSLKAKNECNWQYESELIKKIYAKL